MAMVATTTERGTHQTIVLPEAAVIRSRWRGLPPRQRVAALLTAEGYSQDEIALRLCRSRKTIDKQVLDARRWMHCRDRVALCRHLIRGGILEV